MDTHSVINASKSRSRFRRNVPGVIKGENFSGLDYEFCRLKFDIISLNFSLSNDQCFPNFLLNELISKHNQEQQERERLFSTSQSIDSEDPAENLKTFLACESNKLSLPDVNIILEVLTQRKVLLEAESVAAQNKLLHDFLENLLKQTEQQQQELEKKVRLIQKDMKIVENILLETKKSCPRLEDVEKYCEKAEESQESTSEKNAVNAMRDEMKQLINEIGSTTSTTASTPVSQTSMYKLRKQRMLQHFEDFRTCYFTNRSEDLHFQSGDDVESNKKAEEQEHMITETNEQSANTSTTEPTAIAVAVAPKPSKALENFRENLIKFSKYSTLRTLSTLNYSNDSVLPSTIVSSIEFDKDSEFFAIAGVTKRIKIFDYYACVRDAVVDIKHPINEMVCSSKISCIAWNNYFKELLAASDYEGIVTVYDVETRTRKRTFQEHDKRCWSVDFNEIDTKLLASGSDDARVKLWSIDCENSVATLEVKTANVCCVKFNPRSSCHLAFGCADHNVHYMDLRNLKEPLCIFKVSKFACFHIQRLFILKFIRYSFIRVTRKLFPM